jgi:hypothetical protein
MLLWSHVYKVLEDSNYYMVIGKNKCIPGYRGRVGGEVDFRGHRKPLPMMTSLIILIVVMVSWMYIVQLYVVHNLYIVQFKYVHLIVCHLNSQGLGFIPSS